MANKQFVSIAVWGGVVALVVAAAIIGGIVVSVLNDGESHKEAMMQSPPPAPPPASRMRAMEEQVHVKGGSGHFELNKAERALFSTLAHRDRANAKLHSGIVVVVVFVPVLFCFVCPTPEMTEFEKLHASVAAIASAQGCSRSLLTPKNVSVHTLPETMAFANIAALAGSTTCETYIGTVEKDLTFSAHLEPKKGEDEDSELFEPRPCKKRRRTSNPAEEEAERVAAARKRLAQSVPALPSSELDVAQKVVTKLVCNLRGPNGEIMVQSYAILAKKLGVADACQRVVIAARLNAGIEMKVQLLKSCLGVCWEDGLLTTLPTCHGIGKLELPLSEEAAAAALFGNAAILLVTSVPSK